MSEFTHKYHTGGVVTSAAAARFTVGPDEVLIQRVSKHCAETPAAKHSPEPCEADKSTRRHFGGWDCECECHDG